MQNLKIVFTLTLLFCALLSSTGQSVEPIEVVNKTINCLSELRETHLDQLIAKIHEKDTVTFGRLKVLYDSKLKEALIWTEEVEKIPSTELFAPQLRRYFDQEVLIEQHLQKTNKTAFRSLEDWEKANALQKSFERMQEQSKHLNSQLYRSIERYASANDLIYHAINPEDKTWVDTLNRSIDVKNFVVLYYNTLIGLRNEFGDNLNETNCQEAANNLHSLSSLVQPMMQSTKSFLPENAEERGIIVQLQRTLSMTEAFTKATFPSLVAGCWRIQRDTATNDEIIAYNNYLDKLDILEREVDDLWNKVENYMKRCTPTSRPD